MKFLRIKCSIYEVVKVTILMQCDSIYINRGNSSFFGQYVARSSSLIFLNDIHFRCRFPERKFEPPGGPVLGRDGQPLWIL